MRGVLQAHLIGQLPALVRSSGTSNHCVITVEVLSDFLEWGVAGLDVEEVDDSEFDGEPDAVNDVVLPANVVEGDGVDVLIEEDWSMLATSFGKTMQKVYSRAMSTDKNMTVMPLARMLYGRISTQYPTSNPDQALLYATKNRKINATTALAAAWFP